MRYKKRLDRVAGIAEKLGVAGMALIVFQKAGGDIFSLAEANQTSLIVAGVLLALSIVMTKED